MSVHDLSLAAIDAETQHFDFSEGYPEEWEYWECCNCEDCDKPVLNTDGQCPHCGNEQQFEGPMMNYRYPLPYFDQEPADAARAIQHLPLCLVQFTQDEEYALALTGGGMDLTWEICAAYVKLGYVPPATFWSSPNMCGVELTPMRRRIIAAIRYGIRSRIRDARYRLAKLAEAVEYMEGNKRERLRKQALEWYKQAWEEPGWMDKAR